MYGLFTMNIGAKYGYMPISWGNWVNINTLGLTICSHSQRWIDSLLFCSTRAQRHLWRHHPNNKKVICLLDLFHHRKSPLIHHVGNMLTFPTWSYWYFSETTFQHFLNILKLEIDEIAMLWATDPSDCSLPCIMNYWSLRSMKDLKITNRLSEADHIPMMIHSCMENLPTSLLFYGKCR